MSEATGAPAPLITLKNQEKSTLKKPQKINSIVKKRKVAIGVFDILIQGEKIRSPAWCNGCRNGGTLIVCSQCTSNAICDICIDFDSISQVDGNLTSFRCPSCFLGDIERKPYPYIYKGVTSTRENWPTYCTDNLAIISIRLEGMMDAGTPALMAYNHIYPWLRGNLAYIDLDFNLIDDNGYENFVNRQTQLMNMFETGELKEYRRFMIFLTTHSTPEEGYFHIGPNNKGSVPILELFKVIFCTRFQNILKRSKDNVLNLLTCGSFIVQSDSKQAIIEFSQLSLFDRIFAFTQSNFQPSFTHEFVMTISLNHFLFRRKSLQQVLLNNQSLGAHTNIVEITKNVFTTFKWTHPAIRPMGHSITNQCPDCKRLKSRKPKVSKDLTSVTLKCDGCKKVQTFYLENNWCWVRGHILGRNDQGAWLVHKETISESSSQLDNDILMD